MNIGWIIFIACAALWHIGLYGMFKKAGIEGWKAFIPFYNTWCMVEKMELNKVWFFLQFIPIAGQFITIWITIKFVEHFGRFHFLHHAAAVLVPFIYFPYLGFSKDEKYAGKLVVENYRKSGAREWVDAAFFAIVAATIIRTFIFEAYTIPTPSMEKTLLVNDFLFVSKFSYGPRLPNTPIAMPFVHHTLPVTGTKSYVEWIKLPYKRWFASPVKRNDVVVFNFPVNDTLINDEVNFGSRTTYYEAVRQLGRERVMQDYGNIIITRPVDKRENFIKRCVAIAGDELKVINGVVYVNGQKEAFFPEAERFHILRMPPNSGTPDAEMLESWGMKVRESQGDVRNLAGEPNAIIVNVTNKEKANLHLPAGYSLVDFIVPFRKNAMSDGDYPAGQLFPYYQDNNSWTVDNYGPLVVPKKGMTIPLTPDNLIRYQRCIEVYEANQFEVKGSQVLINGKPATSYTFKMDYFWMMGDNRHNSLDSRYWGFVPEDHIVGKASLIWFSWEGGPRWKRFFKGIK